MGIQDWSENIIFVDLPQSPEMGNELESVTQIVRERGDCDVVIDFSCINIVISSGLSKLQELRKLLADSGHRLVFCSVSAPTKGIFTITDLDVLFEFAGDKHMAMASLRKETQQALHEES